MKRLGFASTVGALVAAMLIPAAASAHTAPVFWTERLASSCKTTGGEHGFGKVRLGMRAYATNNTPDAPTTNVIVIRSKFQEKVDGVWTTIGVSTVTTPVHPDGETYAFTNLLIEEFSFREADHPQMRMIMRAVFWDDLESGDVRVGSIRIQSDAC